MSKYKFVHQCAKCKKVYSGFRYYDVALYNDSICPKCGTRGRFVRKIGKRTLLGWKFINEN